MMQPPRPYFRYFTQLQFILIFFGSPGEQMHALGVADNHIEIKRLLQAG